MSSCIYYIINCNANGGILKYFSEVAIYSAFGLTIVTIIPSIIQLIITLCQNKGSEIMKGAKNIPEQVGFMGDVRDELELI